MSGYSFVDFTRNRMRLSITELEIKTSTKVKIVRFARKIIRYNFEDNKNVGF